MYDMCRVFLLVSKSYFMRVGFERNWSPQQYYEYILGETSFSKLQHAETTFRNQSKKQLVCTYKG